MPSHRHFAISILLMLGTPVGAQRAPDLDLTGVARPVPAEEATGTPKDGVLIGKGVVGGGGFGGISRVSPLRARLVRLEPRSCEWTESLSYDLELRNVSRTDVKVPWSVDPRDMGEQDSDVVRVLILSLGTTTGEGLLDGVEVLYGSSFAPFTTRLLRPGESAIIRANAGCRINSPRDEVLSVARTDSLMLQVFANVTLAPHPQALGLTTKSNATPLRVHMQPR